MKKTYKVEGLHCASCAMVIESDLEDMGINATCSYAKQTLEVEYDEQYTNDEVIFKQVNKSGYRLKPM